MQIIQGDCLEVLKTLPDQSVQTIVTSPPYYGLRDYGTAKWEGGSTECDHLETNDTRDPKITKQTQNAGTSKIGYKTVCHKCGAIRIDSQIGLEPTPDEYVAKLVSVFRECRRVLRDDGTLWLNLGDSYTGGGAGRNDGDHRADGRPGGMSYKATGVTNLRGIPDGLKPKDLIGIPWRVAFALQQPYYRCLGCENVAQASEWGKFPNGRLICPACELSKGHAIDEQGWYLRSDIIWHKPNPMPESVKDRPTKAHEYIFLLAKSQRYYYDAEAIFEPHASTAETYESARKTAQEQRSKHLGQWTGGKDTHFSNPMNPAGRNKRTVWTVTTKPYREAHFATFPPALIEPCILAGCPVGGTVLDPFNGSGTTGAVALKHGRDYIGIELNPEYIELTYKRLSEVQPRLEVE